MRITKIKVISEYSSESLERQVNDALEEGFCLHGPLHVDQHSHDKFTQALVKYEVPAPPVKTMDELMREANKQVEAKHLKTVIDQIIDQVGKPTTCDPSIA